MSIAFLITSFIVVVSPGTGVLYTLAAGLSRGSRASVIAAFGCTIGIVPHMAAAIMGVAALLHASALAFQAFKYVGVAYLLYMAWNALREQGALKVEKEVGSRSAMQVTVTAILINILNPKLSIDTKGIQRAWAADMNRRIQQDIGRARDFQAFGRNPMGWHGPPPH